MRVRLRIRQPIPILPAACLLLAVGATPARAGDPPPPAAIVGTVVRAEDGGPLAYANVFESTRRFGAVTDERGAFRLVGLPPGRHTIRVQSLGSPPLEETLDLAPGDTLRRTYRLATPPRERFLQIRDSLAAAGRWPPTLDPELHAHMREALDVRVFRLDPEHPVLDAPPDPQRRIGPWPIVAETAPPERPVVAELIETLRIPDLYLSDLQGEKKVCGGFSPGIDVRFTSLGVPVDVLLCYACGEFAILRDGKARQSGDFMGHGAAFVRFAQRAFPRDKAFKKLGKETARAR